MEIDLVAAQKSDIVCVILAGSSFFALSEAKSGLLSSADGLLARAARHFSRILTFLAPEKAKICSPAGASV